LIDQHQLGEQLLPFFLDWPSSSFSKPGLVPDFKSGKCWRMLTPKIAKRIERKRSQKLGQKKGAYAPLIFELALS